MTNQSIDETTALEGLILADLEAQRAIHEWEAHRSRIQGVLRPQIGEGAKYEGETGTAGWELRNGEVDYPAVLQHVVTRLKELGIYAPVEARQSVDALIDSVTTDIDFFRKPHSYRFFVRAALKRAPKPPDTLLEDLTNSITHIAEARAKR